MKRKIPVILVIILAVTFLFAACGSPTTTQQTTASADNSVASTTSEATTAASVVNISILGHSSREAIGKAGFATGLFAALDSFTKDNPQVKVDYQGLDQTNYQTKINTLAAANDMPDMFMLKGSWTKNFVDNGWVSDITKELDADSAWKNGYIKGGFDNASVDGKIYGVPQQSMITSIVYYNSEMWSSIGYDKFPATWADLQSAVEKFKAKGITPFVMGNKPNWPAESCWLSTLADRVTGPEWTNSILTNSGAKFTDPDFVKALKIFQDFAKSGAFNTDINSIDDSEQQTVYFNKKAAAICSGTWFIATIDASTAADVKSATHLALLPSIEGGKGDPNSASGGPAWFLSISNKVPNDDSDLRKQSIALLKYLTDGHQADITASLGDITAWANPNYDKSKASPLYNEYINMFKDAKSTPIYDACMDNSVIQTMNVGLQDLLINRITPEDLAAQIQKQQDIVNSK